MRHLKRVSQPLKTTWIWHLGGLLCLSINWVVGQNELYFSEYIEGSSNNKSLEIHNPTSSNVSMSSYTLEIYSNGNSVPSFSFPLIGNVPAQDVFVISHPASAGAILSETDMTFAGIANFNGNDAIALRKGASLVDLIGNIGCDPSSSGWISGANGTVNQVLVRKACTLSGITSDPAGTCPFPTLASEWTSYSASDFSHLGAHDWFHIDQSSMPPLPRVSATSPSSCNNDDGQISISEVFGSNLEYSLNNGASFDAGPINVGLGPGTYDVMIRVISDHSCRFTHHTELFSKDPPMISYTPMAPDCLGKPTGSIDLEVVPPAPEYGFSWDNPLIGDQEDPTDLFAGTYSVTVIDNNNPTCTTAVNNILIPASEVIPVMPNLDDVGPLCTDDAPLILAPTQDGVNGDWSGNGVVNNTFNPFALAGDHVLTFTPDENECAINGNLIVHVAMPKTPVLAPFPDLCSLDPPIELPNVQDGVEGLWSGPGVIDQRFEPAALAGSQVLIFTPLPTECAQENSISVTVTAASPPGLDPIANQCTTNPPFDLPEEQGGVTGHWSGPGVTNNTFVPGTMIGPHELKFVPDSGQCSSPSTIVVNVFEPGPIQLDPLPGICASFQSYVLPKSVNGVGGTWSRNQGIKGALFDPTGLSGTQELTFTPDLGQCLAANNTTIEIFEDPAFEATPKHPQCPDALDGGIEVTINLGKEPFSFDWDVDGTGDFNDLEDLGSLGMGSYTVEVRDANGCSDSKTIELLDPEAFEVSISSSPETVENANDGEISVEVSGGQAPHTFAWSHGSTAANLTDLMPGSYTLTITDANECKIDTTITIATGCSLSASIDVQDLFCRGEANGRATITPTRSTGKITYRWSHDVSLHTSVASGLAAGIYAVTLTDEAECTYSLDFEVNPPGHIQSDALIHPETAPGANDGSIVLALSGGKGPYTARWTDGETDLERYDLSAGRYRVEILDSLGCRYIDSFEITVGICLLTTEVAKTDIQCHGDSSGAAVVNVIDAVGPVQYTWSHDSDLQNPMAERLTKGTYHVMTSDASCSIRDTFEIKESPAIDVTATVTSTLDTAVPTGAISLNITGGSGSYSVHWSTGDSSLTINGLNVGFHQVMITDQAGCRLDTAFYIDLKACRITASITTQSPSCVGEDDGSAIIEISKGTGPITYHWNHDESHNDSIATMLAVGSYMVTIADEFDCSLVLPYQIDSASDIVISFDVAHESMVGAADGWVKALVSGGEAPYNFKWSIASIEDSIFGLQPDTYALTVTDARGCTKSSSANINSSACSLFSNLVFRNARCANEPSGLAVVGITGGVLPVALEWSHDSTLQSTRAENLAVGQYSVTVTDGDGCTHAWPFTIEAPLQLSLTNEVKHESGAGQNDGAIQVFASGGKAPYKYIWSGGSRDHQIANLEPGSYHLTVTDDLGCTLFDTLEVRAADACQLQISAVVTASGCMDATGQIELQLENSTGNIEIDWDQDEYDGQMILVGLTRGNYHVRVTDDQCALEDSFRVQVDSILGIDYQLIPEKCTGHGGRILIVGSQGGSRPNRMTLDGTLIIDFPFDGLLADGIHHLVVEDHTGCRYEESLEIGPASRQILVTKDTTIKRGQEVQIIAAVPFDLEGAQFKWQGRDGIICPCLQFSAFPTESQIYQFQFEGKEGCRVIEEVRVNVSEQNLFYLPNAVSPNGDGINDDWMVYDGLNLIQNIESLKVFDHRGTIAFEGENILPNQQIEGLHEILMKVVAPEVIFYLMSVRFTSGYQKTYRGTISVIR